MLQAVGDEGRQKAPGLRKRTFWSLLGKLEAAGGRAAELSGEVALQ